MVVLYGQPENGWRQGVRLSTHVFPKGAGGGDARAEDRVWRTNQIYMAHFALTDVKTRTHTSFERYSRGTGGLAGAQGEPTYEVWLEDWSVSQDRPGDFRLRAVDDQIDPRIAINLNLQESRPPLLHGDAGV